MRITSHLLRRAALAVLASAALSLTACVESGAPLISNAKPLLGQEFRVHLYDYFSEGRPRAFHAAAYRWVNGEYVRAGGLDATRENSSPSRWRQTISSSSRPTDKASALYSGSDESSTTALISSSPSIWRMRTTRHAKGSAATSDVCRISSHEQLWSWRARPLAKPPSDPVLGVVLAK